MASEGKPILSGAFLVMLILGLCACSFDSIILLAGWGISVVFLLFSLYFFRDPRRNGPKNASLILAPADGKVVRIISIDDPEVGKQARLVSIFLSVFNVHANRMPVDGKFAAVNYKTGKFLAAYEHAASDVNEQSDILIESQRGKIRIKQIAGILARRILCYAEKGGEMRQGERLGFIRFGSRTDIVVPSSVEIKVAIGDKMTGGISVIGEFE